jgi:hypothetical protein
MGPGTHIVERVTRGDQPVSRADALALLHDIDYLRVESATQELLSDWIAISKTDNSLSGLAMKVGLGFKALYFPNAKFSNRDNPDKQLAISLANHLNSNPEYRKTFLKHGLLDHFERWQREIRK